MAQAQSGYSDAQIRAMHKDAVRRVNEMQRVARQRVNSSPSPPSKEENSLPHIEQESEPIKPVISETACQSITQTNGLTGFLDRMNLDEEKILLIMLLILLINEGADTYLVLALVYILI